MNGKKQNTLFQLISALQVGLLVAQGGLLIVSSAKTFCVPIWVGLALCSLAQLLIIFTYPKKIEMTQLMDRSAMLKLRIVAMVPYVLILIGLLIGSV